MDIESAIEKWVVYDVVGHTPCMYVVGPRLKTFDVFCELVDSTEYKLAIIGLGGFTGQAKVAR